MTESLVPELAVVGHPNKGKSCLVATLAQDDSVAISATPGTTLRSRDFPMRVDGRHLYTLIDTPGFQRARHVLEWLRSRSEETGTSAADRPRLVAEFLAEPGHAARFPDECELLRPIVEGAGILYVVDGSVPYGPEYEAEMEVLRWTGRPSMAIINPIGRADHVDAWRDALGQFFRVVRVVDALRADHATRRELLRAFGALESDWGAPIDTAVAALDADRQARRHASAREIAALLGDALGLVVERRVAEGEEPARHAEALEGEFKAQLETLEAAHRRRVQRIYAHHDLEANAAALEVLERDLFSEGTWITFGLRRRDLVAAGAAGGAATGGALDLALGGASFLLGAGIGAAIGGVLGWWGTDRIAELRIVNQPLGGKLARYGPSKNLNFPFVLFGRARYHWDLVAQRTHAMRGALELASAPSESHPLEATARRDLDRIFGRLRKTATPSADRLERLRELEGCIERVLESDESSEARALAAGRSSVSASSDPSKGEP